MTEGAAPLVAWPVVLAAVLTETTIQAPSMPLNLDILGTRALDRGLPPDLAGIRT